MTTRLREIVAGMTAGPWNYEPERYSALCVIGIKPRDDQWVAHCQPELNGEANGKGIVTLRNLSPEMLDVIDAARIMATTLDEVLKITEQHLRVTVNGVEMRFDPTAELHEALAAFDKKVGEL